jgi:hypothetical protein
VSAAALTGVAAAVQVVLSWADSEIRGVVASVPVPVPGQRLAGVVIQWSAASVARQVAAPDTHGRGAVEHGFMTGLELSGLWVPGQERPMLPALLGRVRAGRLQCEGVWQSQLPVPWRSPAGALVVLELQLANGVDCVWRLQAVHLGPADGVVPAFAVSLAC